MKVITTVTFLAVIIATCSGAGIRSVRNAQVGNEEQAPYEVVKQHEGFEERLYPAQKWVTTTMESPSMQRIMDPMFMRLFRYIGGNNTLNVGIDMTVPVTTHVSRAEFPNFSYNMGFYVPQIHQADPPTGAQDVVIEDRPELRVFTRAFGGFADDDVVAKETEALASLIRQSGQTGVDFSHYYVVGYDPPFKFTNRRNEIWYVKTSA